MTSDSTDLVNADKAAIAPDADRLPATGFLRLKQITGDRKAKPPVPAIIPISPSAWWAGIKEGIYPEPVKLSARTTAWKVEDVVALIERLSKGEG